MGASTATAPRAQVEQALFDATTELAQGAKYPPGQVQEAYNWISQKVAALPHDVPVAELNRLKTDLRSGIGSWGPGTTNNADTTIRKAVSGAAGDAVRAADPDAAAVMDRMRTNIPLSESLDRAESAAIKRDPIPPFGQVAAAGSHPSAAALSMVKQGGVPIAQTLYDAGRALPSGIDAQRAALLALLMSGHTQK